MRLSSSPTELNRNIGRVDNHGTMVTRNSSFEPTNCSTHTQLRGVPLRRNGVDGSPDRMEEGSPKTKIDAKLDALPAQLSSHFLKTMCNSASSAKSRNTVTPSFSDCHVHHWRMRQQIRTDPIHRCSHAALPKDNGNPEAVKSKTFATVSHQGQGARSTVSGSPTWVMIPTGHSPPSHKQANTSRKANDSTPAQANSLEREPCAPLEFLP